MLARIAWDRGEDEAALVQVCDFLEALDQSGVVVDDGVKARDEDFVRPVAAGEGFPEPSVVA